MKLPDPRSFPYRFLRRFTLPPRIHWLAAKLVNDRFLIGVAGIIHDSEGRLLLFHHTYRRRHPWGLPGGWMMRGESPLEALEREVREESGMAVHAERLLLIGTTSDRAKLEFVVQARVIDATFRPSREVSEADWYPTDQLPPLPSFHRIILAQVARLSPGEVGWYTAPWIITDRS
ncbi:MAG: hypothetical protein KatS3mg057_2847 [Herpetosiphonaceae bacterium]|nr:MAG: hypothetical protein KatS3mg057_2847 [Herpetosiphonaceae bacterium]